MTVIWVLWFISLVDTRVLAFPAHWVIHRTIWNSECSIVLLQCCIALLISVLKNKNLAFLSPNWTFQQLEYLSNSRSIFLCIIEIYILSVQENVGCQNIQLSLFMFTALTKIIYFSWLYWLLLPLVPRFQLLSNK